MAWKESQFDFKNVQFDKKTKHIAQLIVECSSWRHQRSHSVFSRARFTQLVPFKGTMVAQLVVEELSTGNSVSFIVLWVGLLLMRLPIRCLPMTLSY